MKREKLGIVRGSGNIYREFDLPNADVRQLKAILAAEIIKALDKKNLGMRKAQSVTGIDAEDFSRVRNSDFRRISVERLMAMINGLGSRVEVAVKVRRMAPPKKAFRSLADFRATLPKARRSSVEVIRNARDEGY
jgi:predicted XRE-type DNA-binding protein